MNAHIEKKRYIYLYIFSINFISILAKLGAYFKTIFFKGNK
jgi:hypothetical protein